MSSLVYLGFSVIAFVISFGVAWLLVPAVLGPFFSALPPITSPSWASTMAHTQSIIQWLIPLSMQLGIFFLVIKVLMVASVRGRD